MNVLRVTLCLALGVISVTQGQPAMDKGPSQKYEEVYSWISLDYDWTNASMKQKYNQSGMFTPHTNAPTGIRVYGEDVFVSVSRWFGGVPSTLNKVVTKSPGSTPVLQPFPSWEMQTIGDCGAFQFVQAMEVDPNTGRLWVVDTGRSGIFDPKATLNSCPAKLVIYDLKTMKEVRRYTFPDSVVNKTQNYLNDIVLDYVDGEVAYAYITDTGKPGLVVYDYKRKESYRFEDDSMSSESNMAIFVEGQEFDPKIPINGIAMSPDFNYVYFCALSGVTLYQVPTAALRNKSSVISSHIRVVGAKPSQGDGMIYSKKNLYFGGLNDSSVYRWEVAKDIKAAPMMSEGKVVLRSVAAILKNETTLQWVDTFAIDQSGYLWFTSPNIGRLFTGKLDFEQTSSPNFRIFKTLIDESSYLMAKTIVPAGSADKEDGGDRSGSESSLLARHISSLFVMLMAACKIFQ